jgi:hypothetical protein
MNKLYKVLRNNMESPFQNFKYEIGKKYHCDAFDTNKNIQCSTGFYATDIDGLVYSFRPDSKIYSCNVWGRKVEIDEFKRRYENIQLIEEIPYSDIKQMALKIENKVGYKLSEALFPIHPLEIDFEKVTKEDIKLLKKWASAWASVGASVGDGVGASVLDSVRASVLASVWASVLDSVWASVGASVRDSVRPSVRPSVWASVWAYCSSLFFNINQWKYVKHRKGVNPFQSCIDLWYRGLVPSYDGKLWRLHGGEGGKIVYSLGD